MTLVWHTHTVYVYIIYLFLFNIIFLFFYLFFVIFYFLFLFDEGPLLETLDYTIRIGSTDLFIFRFVSLLRLRNTRLCKFYMLQYITTPACVCNVPIYVMCLYM